MWGPSVTGECGCHFGWQQVEWPLKTHSGRWSRRASLPKPGIHWEQLRSAFSSKVNQLVYLSELYLSCVSLLYLECCGLSSAARPSLDWLTCDYPSFSLSSECRGLCAAIDFCFLSSQPPPAPMLWWLLNRATSRPPTVFPEARWEKDCFK